MAHDTQLSPANHQSRRVLMARASFALLLLLLIGSAGVGWYFFTKYQQAAANNPETKRQDLLQLIGQSVQLPDEEPLVLTIADKAKLSNESFARKVENGDQLLVFNKAKRLIVFRPATKKVIDMLAFESTPAAGTKQLP